MITTQRCCVLFWTNPGSSTSQTPHKLSKKDEKDMLSTAVEVKTNSLATVFYGLLHMDTPVFDNLQSLMFMSSVRTLDAV